MNTRKFAAVLAATGLCAVASQATAEDFRYAGEVTEATDSFAVLTPPGTPSSGLIEVNNPGIGGNTTDPADITSIEIIVGGFCFVFNATCSDGSPNPTDITSIDNVDLTIGANGVPTAGIIDVTAFSNIFQNE